MEDRLTTSYCYGNIVHVLVACHRYCLNPRHGNTYGGSGYRRFGGRMLRSVSQSMDEAYPPYRCRYGGSRHRFLAFAHRCQQFCRRSGSGRLRQCRQLDCRFCDDDRMPYCTGVRSQETAFAVNTHWTDCRLYPRIVHGDGEL